MESTIIMLVFLLVLAFTIGRKWKGLIVVNNEIINTIIYKLQKLKDKQDKRLKNET